MTWIRRTLLSSIALAAGPAFGGGLDFVEVGGPWGTPTSLEPTAIWWNPGALAAGRGHRLLVEGAPSFGKLSFERADPNGGSYEMKSSGLVPFLGIATDLGLDGPGLGLALAVPSARSGHATDPEGVGRYHAKEVDVRAIHLVAAGGYDIRDRVSVGLAGHLVLASWQALLDVDSMPDTYDALLEQNMDPGYTDADLEDPSYAATLDYDPLTDRAFTWSAGLRVQLHERVAAGVAWIAPYSLDHRGDLHMTFSCPPQSDIAGREGAEQFGLCDADGAPVVLVADAGIGYGMPGRLHLGVAVDASDALRIEGFGGLVTWSAYKDLLISIAGIDERNSFDEEPPGGGELTASFVEMERKWARGGQNSFFAGLDLKARLRERLVLGGRLLYDRAALVDQALSVNNWDADALVLTALFAVRAGEHLRLGLSFGHHFFATRRVSGSYAMAIDSQDRPDDRWNFPHMSGTYSGNISRLGLSLAVEL